MNTPHNEDMSMDFPSLSELEAARHEILDRVASNLTGASGDLRAYHSSHSSSPTGKGHISVVSNRPASDDLPL